MEVTLGPPHSHLSRFTSDESLLELCGKANGNNWFVANHTEMHAAHEPRRLASIPHNLIWVRGQVPGAEGNFVFINDACYKKPDISKLPFPKL
ncbi:hypothetical protein YC2023_012270 [Brassica napus]